MTRPSLPFRHALIIGGTGMLIDAAAALATSAAVSTSVARTHRSQNRLVARLANPDCHSSVDLDWNDRPRFLSGVSVALTGRPAPDVVLAWLHDPHLILDVLSLFDEQVQSPRLFHVIGSATRDPLAMARDVRRKVDAGTADHYHQIILGYVRAAGGARWLTDPEICFAVARSLEAMPKELIVGQVQDWASRP